MIFGTPIVSILCFLIAAFFGALGQFLYKSGADLSDGTIAGYLVNPRLLLGVMCYILVMALFVAGFRFGGRMTVLYPVYATTFVWAALIANRVYGTPVTAVNMAGIILLIAAIWLIAQGDSQ